MSLRGRADGGGPVGHQPEPFGWLSVRRNAARDSWDARVGALPDGAPPGQSDEPALFHPHALRAFRHTGCVHRHVGAAAQSATLVGDWGSRTSGRARLRPAIALVGIEPEPCATIPQWAVLDGGQLAALCAGQISALREAVAFGRGGRVRSSGGVRGVGGPAGNGAQSDPSRSTRWRSHCLRAARPARRAYPQLGGDGRDGGAVLRLDGLAAVAGAVAGLWPDARYAAGRSDRSHVRSDARLPSPCSCCSCWSSPRFH